MFSSVIRLGDLDFIAPSQACIKPMLDAQKLKKLEEEEGKAGGGKILIPGRGDAIPLPPQPVKITLADCLACSGCVTTAEEVLIQQQQPSEVTAAVEKIRCALSTSRSTVLVASISPQTVASLCVQYHDATPHDTFKRLTVFLTSIIGMHHVVSTQFGQHISRREVVAQFKSGKIQKPMLASSCPGFVCYMEKSHPALLPHLSTAMSPQGVLGSVLSLCFPEQDVYHVSLQPCFDRKLEASREKLSEKTQCVLSTLEVIEWIRDRGVNWSELPTTASGGATLVLQDDLNSEPLISTAWRGSGAYHQAIMYDAMTSPPVDSQLVYTPKRNQNHCDVTLASINPSPRVGIMYGFQHIQNLCRGLKKRNHGLPDFIEVMACPGGCTNGGAQGRPRPGEENQQLLSIVNDTFHSYTAALSAEDETFTAPSSGGLCKVVKLSEIYKDFAPCSEKAQELFHMTFVNRQEQEIPDEVKMHTIKW